MCKLTGDSCQGAGSGWHCCSAARGYPFDFDAGCVARTSLPIGCASEPAPIGDECSGNAGTGCVMRSRDAGIEAFWTPSDYGGFISIYDDVTACTEEVEMAVMTADRCPP